MRGLQYLSTAVLIALAAGCGDPQPFVTPERLSRGLVLVVTGIEGRSPINEDICQGLNEGGVNCAIELVDWTYGMPGAYLANLWSEARNRKKAEDIAHRVIRYQIAHPDLPVVLIGQSGGAAIALWIAESMPPGGCVDGIILLAASLSPDYALDMALLNSRSGIVSFHSLKDWVFLGAGTFLSTTMDGKHTESAGRVGFNVPAASTLPRAYQKVFQIAWHKEMEKAGHTGGHLTVVARPFVARYVAPLLKVKSWDGQVIQSLLAGKLTTRPAESTGGR